jgi:cation transport regulator ChaB
MPKTGRDGRAKKSELPSTLQRSGRKAQQTFAEAHDSALETYDGDESRAYRVAFAAVKHTHEKVGDHWEKKDQYGPSDERAEQGGPRSTAPSAGGVDANATKKHLYELATRLGVKGRSTMSKDELVEALQKANDRASAKARR